MRLAFEVRAYMVGCEDPTRVWYKLHEVYTMYETTPTTPSRRLGLVGLFICATISAVAFTGVKPAAAESVLPPATDNRAAGLCESVARSAPSTGWREIGSWVTVEPFRKTLEIKPGTPGAELLNGKTFWFAVHAKGRPSHPTEPMVELNCYAYVNGQWNMFGKAMLPGQVSGDKKSVTLKSVLTPELCAKIIEEAAKNSSMWGRSADGKTLTLKPIIAKVLGTELSKEYQKYVGKLSYIFSTSYISAQIADVMGERLPAKCFVYDATTKSYVTAATTTVSSGGGRFATMR